MIILLCQISLCVVLILFVFFFKQKTAYEMRISDWSSDVCSSDLMLNGNMAPEEIIKSVKKGLYAVNFGGGQVDITSGKFVFSAAEAWMIEDEIGRASCRERVCQYV